MKKSVISKFLLGSFLVPSLLTNNAHVKAGGDDYCLGPRGKLPSCFLTNVLLYLPNSDDRMRVSQTCKNGQTANLQVRMLDLAKYGQTNYPKKWKPKEQKAKEAEALKNELIKSVNVNPKIEAIRLSYRQFSLLKNHQFSEEDTISLKNVFANKIVRFANFLSTDLDISLLSLGKFKSKFGVEQFEVEKLIFDRDPGDFDLQDIQGMQLFSKVRTILCPEGFGFGKEKAMESTKSLDFPPILAKVGDGNSNIILEKLQNKDKNLVIYDTINYKQEETIAMLRDANIYVKTLNLYSIDALQSFLKDLQVLKNIKDVKNPNPNGNELQNLMFPQCIKLKSNSECQCKYILKPICDLLKILSDPDLKFNSPVIEFEDIDYNHTLFTKKMMFAPRKKISINTLRIKGPESAEQFIEDLKTAKELNMLDRFNFKVWFTSCYLTPDQQKEIFEYLPECNIHILKKPYFPNV